MSVIINMRKENDMKELNLHDLTPALMKELEQLNSADAIVSFLKEKGFAASQEISERIYNKLHGVKNLAEDKLSAVSGGSDDDDDDEDYEPEDRSMEPPDAPDYVFEAPTRR